VTTSFPEFMLEQSFDETVVYLAIPALVYLALLAAVWLVLRRRPKAAVLGVVLVSSAAALAVAVAGITLFEASALWFRSDPQGSGSQRQGTDYDDFFASARAAFFALYAGLVLLAVGIGFVTARVRGRSAAVAAAGCAIAVAGYLALTLPFVDFLNACNVGRPFVSDSRC
jgi:hypothetical protein